MSWLEVRDSESWALVGGSCLASDIHGWVAHQVLMRNSERGVMKSNSLDGEFIRLLSGTHHVASSFKPFVFYKSKEIFNKFNQELYFNLLFLFENFSLKKFFITNQ